MKPFSCSSSPPLPSCHWQQLKQPISLRLLFNTGSSTRHCFETVTSVSVCVCVCVSVCHWQRMRQTRKKKKKNPERHKDGRRGIKRRWRRDRESSQKEKRSQTETVCSASHRGDEKMEMESALRQRWIPIYGPQLSLHKTSIIQPQFFEAFIY